MSEQLQLINIPVIILFFLLFTSFSDSFAYRIAEAYFFPSRKIINHKWKHILKSRSFCDHCEQSIPPLHLVPVLGYFFAHGKCSHCKKSIHIKYPLMEIIGLLYGILTAWFHPDFYYAGLTLFFMVNLYIISVIDFHFFIIPTIPLLLSLAAAIFNLVLLSPATSFLILTISIAFSWYAILHIIRFMAPEKLGMGDIHLIFILSLAILPPHSLYLPTVASAFAFIFIVFIRNKTKKDIRKIKIPFGLFLSLAFLVLRMLPDLNLFM